MTVADALDAHADDLFTGEHVDDFTGGDLDAARCAKLFGAVIARAWRDAFIAGDCELATSHKSGKPGGARHESAERERSEARKFLVSDLSPWREDRERVCDLAGLNPQKLREAAKRHIAAIRVTEPADSESAAEPMAATVDNMNVLDFSEALAHLIAADLPAADLDQALTRLAALESQRVAA